MNEGKIFLVNVSKGRIGEDNSGLLGGMIITKIQLAAMERVRIPEDHRKDFYLYVDEFQNFVTDAFAGILSEARKYRLNLTVAHQYTAQLVADKSSAVRDAVFGNVGTMIVFRVGSDDADFLEKEFDPEFTPSDIVNLPNYKIYLKLMIDGVTSRPFSAKTLPPMVKSGNKKIEEEVIKSSRNLYCRPKGVVEKEINDWSGMSLGNETDVGSGSLEKFPIVCSLCKLEKTVPFKPEPGRAVYCKECIAKIKSGEVKAEKGRDDQIKYDESKYFKPLADLGIEFKQKNGRIEEDNRYPERVDKPIIHVAPPKKFFSTIKKVFIKEPNLAVKPPSTLGGLTAKPKDNTALREFLDKTLSGLQTEFATEPIPEPATASGGVPLQAAISLDTLKNKVKEPESLHKPVRHSAGGDRAASVEDMSKLKDLIEEKIVKKEPFGDTQDKPLSMPIPQKPKEVPEDVLKKVLE